LDQDKQKTFQEKLFWLKYSLIKKIQ
jgi:hypothetical protein